MDSSPAKYQVIARKYRPQTFSDVLGQESIVTTLKNALHYNRLAHAYLFCGCRGTGKTTLARVFAKALNCSNLTEDFEPCNTCSSCIDIIAGRSLDVLEIDGASNRGIDDIRQINETIGYAPSSGKYKIYIIDEVHMLTKEAFNALLKTLEEPPANVKFFFATTEPHKVLPTIISRCQRFDLNRIPFAALKKKLAWIAQDLNIPCDDEVFSLVANLAEGSLRDAESVFDQIICYAEHPITAAKVSTTLGIMPRSVFFLLDQAFDEQNLSYAFELANDIFSSGKDLSYFIDNLIEHYRCILKLKLGASIDFPTNRLKERYTASLSLYTGEQCLYILDFLIQWQQQIGKTPFKRVSLEMILLHILRSKHRLSLPALVKRLHELEQKSRTAPSLTEALQSEPEKKNIAEIYPAAVQVINERAIEVEKVEAVPISNLKPTEKVSEPETPIAAVSDQGTPSLEETLLKRFREKIESTPAYVDEPLAKPILENAIVPNSHTQEISELPPKQSSLLFSKAKWEAVASDGKTIEKPQDESYADKLSIYDPITTTIETHEAATGAETLTEIQDKSYACKPIIGDPIAVTVENPEEATNASLQSRYDTVMRFAAIELEGIIKKEQLNG